MSLFGKEFIAGGDSLRYLAIAAIFSSLLTVLGKFNATINKMWMNLSFNMFWAGLLVLSSIYFVDQGAVGISKAYLTAYAILFAVQFTYSMKKIK
ncbi:hypothetical protein GCM10007963_30900 [Lutibacter litoralis]|nr:hypothetical protein GCM10007963_30900 [Lutibacter litoralis]